MQDTSSLMEGTIQYNYICLVNNFVTFTSMIQNHALIKESNVCECVYM